MTQKSRFGFWLILLPKVVVDPKFKDHRNSLIKLPRMVYLLFGEGQIQG